MALSLNNHIFFWTQCFVFKIHQQTEMRIFCIIFPGFFIKKGSLKKEHYIGCSIYIHTCMNQKYRVTTKECYLQDFNELFRGVLSSKADIIGT